MNKIAIIGYKNALAKNLLDLLSLRGYTKDKVSVFAPHVQGNVTMSFGDEILNVYSIDTLQAKDFAAIIFTDSEQTATKYAPKLASADSKIINATSALEGDEKIPMIVGGINDTDVIKSQKNIINVPHPYIVELLGALANINQKYQIKTLRISAFVSADFEGQDGMSELYNQTRRILMNDTASSVGLFHKTLAFNVVPQVGSFIGEETYNEWLYNSQIKQVLGANIKVHANCAVVPVFVGMGMFVNVETIQDIDADEAREDIKKTRGVLVLDTQQDGGYASMTDVQGENSIFVSRIRQDMTVDNGISLWIAGDAYKIAAQNILALLKQFLKKDK